MRITVENRGPEAAQIDLLPTVWFRNTWSWDETEFLRPGLRASSMQPHVDRTASTPRYGTRCLFCDGSPELLFTENETNAQRLYGAANVTPFVKDGIHDFVVNGRREAVNPASRNESGGALSPHGSRPRCSGPSSSG